MKLLDRAVKQPLSLFLVLWFSLLATETIAKEREARFESGPLLSKPNQFFEISALLLNEPENSLRRQQGAALAKRAYGSRARDEGVLAALDADDLARDYIASFNGWVSALRSEDFVLQLDIDPVREINVMHLPGGQEVRVPMSQAITLHRESIQVRGHTIMEKAAPKEIAAQYLAVTDGDCPFADGPIQIFQDNFLVEGRRKDQLLFWGAVGNSRAYFETAEVKYVKVSSDKRRKTAAIDFPDEPSELYSSRLTDPTLVLTGMLFKKCTITLTPEPTLPGTPPADETPSTRLV